MSALDHHRERWFDPGWAMFRSITNNVVAFNGKGGFTSTGNHPIPSGAPAILIRTEKDYGFAGGAPTGVTLLGNVIYGNQGQGIDLNPDPWEAYDSSPPFGSGWEDLRSRTGDGVTANDLLDVDTGPNHLQNFPVLSAGKQAGGGLTVQGTLNSAPSQQYIIQVFRSDTGVKLGEKTVTTNSSGNASFSMNTAAAPLGTALVATATLNAVLPAPFVIMAPGAAVSQVDCDFPNGLGCGFIWGSESRFAHLRSLLNSPTSTGTTNVANLRDGRSGWLSDGSPSSPFPDPDSGNKDQFAAGITGTFTVASDANGNGSSGESIDIVFSHTADDQAQLWIEGVDLRDPQNNGPYDWTPPPYLEDVSGDAALTTEGCCNTVSATATLTEGQTYTFHAYLHEDGSDAILRVNYALPGVVGSYLLATAANQSTPPPYKESSEFSAGVNVTK